MDATNRGSTIEEKVAQAILQQPTQITVGGKEYTAAPPSTATLILVSEAVSRLPHTKLNAENVVGESLSVAQDCKALGDIAAILLIGAKDINETVITCHTEEKSCLWGLIHYKRTITHTETRKAAVARELLESLRPSELNALIARLLQGMELGDFFGLTTFLTEINLLRQTKVEN